MNKIIILLTLLPTLIFSQSKDEIIKITEPTIDNALQVRNRAYRDCNYLDRDVYIINKSNVTYQGCNTRRLLDVDINSFGFPDSDETDYFALDKNGVYFRGEKIAIDTTGFKVVGSTFHDKELFILWKTNAGVYNGNKKVEVSDIETFAPVECYNGYYFKDKYSVYYFDKKIEGSDGASVHKSCDEYTYDNNQAYYRGEILILDNEKVKPVNTHFVKTSKYAYKLEIPRMTGYYPDTIAYRQPKVDVRTLRSLSEKYAVDKNNAYYETTIMPVPQKNLKDIRVWDQDNSAYLSDNVKVYRRDTISDFKLDAKTFGMLPHSDFFYDKNGVYKNSWEESIREVILDKFPFSYTEPVSTANMFYCDNLSYIVYLNQAYSPWKKELYKDLTPQQVQDAKQNRLYLTKTKENIQTKVQDSYGYNLYQADNKIYWGKTATIADAATFTYINPRFYKDKQHLYSYDSDKGLTIVEGFDKETLKTYKDFLMDKDFLYSNTNKIIESKDIETLAIFSGYRKGCSIDQTPTSNYYVLKNYKGYWLVLVSNTVTVRNITDIINDQDQWVPNLKEKFDLNSID